MKTDRSIAAVVVLFAGLMLLGGCASDSGRAPATQQAQGGQGGPHAECLVCKYNSDLACVDVAVDKDTPSTVRDGKTYYFCSKECEQKFEKDPAKYLSQK